MTDQHGNEWIINDTRGYVDAGPSCDECGACECGQCEGDNSHWDRYPDRDGALCAMDDGDQAPSKACECHTHNPDHECVGLSVAYVCLDGGEALCEACFEKSGIELKEENVNA